MTTLDLYNIAEKEKIGIFYKNFYDLDGLFYSGNIYLNKNIINSNKERMVLAEELGHYFTGVYPTPPFSTEYYNKLLRSKNEFKAKKWLISNLIPFDKLNRFLKANLSKFDIADELDVDASLVEDAFYIYNIKQ